MAGLDQQLHVVLRHFAAHHQTRFLDLRKAFDDLVNLARVHKHAAHFGGLVSATQPAFDALVGTACGARAGQYGGQVAGAKTDQRVIRVQRGDHQFTDLAFGHGVAGAGAHDLDNHAFIKHHAFAGSGFIRDQTDVCGGVALVRGNTAFAQPVTQ